MFFFEIFTAIWEAGFDVTTQTSAQKNDVWPCFAGIADTASCHSNAGPVALSGVSIGAAAIQEGTGVYGTEATPGKGGERRGGCFRVLQTAATG